MNKRNLSTKSSKFLHFHQFGNDNSTKEMEQEATIEKQKKEIIYMSHEIINLTKEISDLKSLLSSKKDIENKIKESELYIKDLEKRNKKIEMESKEKERKLNQQINNIISERENQKLKIEQDNIVYKQKMSVINFIEMENKIFKNEIKELKEKQEQYKKKTEEDFKKMEFGNVIKYSNLKKKMLECLAEAKEDILKLKIEYLNINGKLAILQNYRLINKLECQSDQNENLLEENKELKKQIFELEKELHIHKKVEIKLATKIKNMSKDINSNSISENFLVNSPRSQNDINHDKFSYSSTSSPMSRTANVNIVNLKHEKLRKLMLKQNNNNINNINISRNRNDIYSNQNLFFNNSKDSEFNNNDNISYSINDNLSILDKKNGSKLLIGDRYNIFDKIMKDKKEENEKLKSENENLRRKIYIYEKKYNGLFSFLEESLDKFFLEVKNRMKKEDRTVYIDIEKIKRFDFSIFDDVEKYNLLILLMNHLLPLITINFRSNCNLSKLSKDVFCTNLNIVDRQFNKNKFFLKDKYLRKAFLGKNNKIKPDLCADVSNGNNCCNSIPILRRNLSNVDYNNKIFSSV